MVMVPLILLAVGTFYVAFFYYVSSLHRQQTMASSHHIAVH
jgi:hypothetical protein